MKIWIFIFFLPFFSCTKEKSTETPQPIDPVNAYQGNYQCHEHNYSRWVDRINDTTFKTQSSQHDTDYLIQVKKGNDKGNPGILFKNMGFFHQIAKDSFDQRSDPMSLGFWYYSTVSFRGDSVYFNYSGQSIAASDYETIITGLKLK